MEIWFKVSGWSYTPEIKPVEAVKVSEKFITYTYKGYGCKQCESRVAKLSSGEAYFQTWEAAHAFLLEKLNARVMFMRRQLEVANGALGNVKGMKVPTT